MTGSKLKCRVAGCRWSSFEFHSLVDHINQDHGGVEGYRSEAPNPLFCDNTWDLFEAHEVERFDTSGITSTLLVGRIALEQDKAEKSFVFSMPKDYKFPTEGDAGSSAERVARAFKYRRNTYIYGPAGTGKSAVVRALCANLNLESAHYPMREGLDPELYIGKEAVVIDEATGLNITKFIPGSLLQDLEGRVGPDGVKRGVVILFDDIDRAPSEYHEILRHVLEDNSRSVYVPELGVTIDLHPDTMIVATANSAGRGDSTGYYASVKEMDESILDRFERVVKYAFMEGSEEMDILIKKFPDVYQKAGKEPFVHVMDTVEIIRNMIANGDIYASFSHRRLVQWLQSLSELLDMGSYSPSLLREASVDWLDWYDETTRIMVVDRAVDLCCGGDGADADADANS